METADILDVTILEPQLKHPTIFQKYDDLKVGTSFVIHNDHDPKPLYYQLLAERGNTFTWKYLEEGPEFWKVKITKQSTEETVQTIGQLVTKDFRRAEVFKKFGLDFCCGGKKTLQKACEDKGIDAVQVEKELQLIEEQPLASSQEYNQWELDFLADYIVNTHHKYVIKSIPVLFEYTKKVASVHGGRHPETIEISNLFLKLVDELNRHMMKEENTLFPYIKILVSNDKQKIKLTPSPFGTIQNPITSMELEHEEVGKLMAQINELSNGYTPPSNACTTYRLSYAKLKEFEDDLVQHIHLENNVLFPKAIALEEKLQKNS